MGKEFPYTDQILLLSAVLFFLVWLLDSFVFRLSEGIVGFVPDVIRIILFVGLEFSAIMLGFYSHKALFGSKGVEYVLVTDGAFAYVRHPLYLSILLTYLGFVFAAMSIASLVPWICYVALFDKMTAFEEEDLVRIFGDRYVEYRKTVPKWIPRLVRPKLKRAFSREE